MRRIGVWVLCLGGLVLGACAGGSSSKLDEARFLMDSCIPSDGTTLANCTSAAAKADDVQVGDPTNVEAASLESSAYLGLAGFSSLGLASELLGLTGDAENDFVTFASFVDDLETTNGRAIDLAALHSAITPLSDALSGVTPTEDNKYAFFQLGILQAIDSFIRPTQLAGANATSASDITDTETGYVLDDFVGADDNLIASDTEDSDFLSPIRNNYCFCKVAQPLGVPAGFTTACLRDLMRCTQSDAELPTQDYDNDGDADLVDCTSLLDQTDSRFVACKDVDTVE